MTIPQANFGQIIKKESRTFFFASLFFPKPIRDQVFDFYAFVRAVDDLVDANPPQSTAFFRIKNKTLSAYDSGNTSQPLIRRFIEIAKTNAIDKQTIAAFFYSQALDLQTSAYPTFRDLGKFIYGVAEVIGLCMAKILQLPPAAQTSARQLGKAMQLINCIRDIDEDRRNGKLYLPLSDLKKFKLSPTNFYHKNNRQRFHKLVRFELKRALTIDRQARRGFRFIPKKHLVAVATAADLYRWTAQQIYRRPDIVLQRQLKPNLITIMITALVNLWRIYVTGYYY